jgi:hypothetical protein
MRIVTDTDTWARSSRIVLQSAIRKFHQTEDERAWNVFACLRFEASSEML